MRVLYICYDGIMDNLGQTQVLPYIFGLNNKGYKFIIFSFERSIQNKKNLLSKTIFSKIKILFGTTYLFIQLNTTDY